MHVGDINTSGRIWEYVPREHKMQHKGQDRVIMIGPKAQAILQEFLKPSVVAYVFSPAEADRERRERLRRAKVATDTKSGCTPTKREWAAATERPLHCCQLPVRD